MLSELSERIPVWLYVALLLAILGGMAYATFVAGWIAGWIFWALVIVIGVGGVLSLFQILTGGGQ